MEVTGQINEDYRGRDEGVYRMYNYEKLKCNYMEQRLQGSLTIETDFNMVKASILEDIGVIWNFSIFIFILSNFLYVHVMLPTFF